MSNSKEREDNTYWNEKGKYQKESDVLEKLVPTNSSSPFTDIELFRIAQNVYYDIYNNGGCNLGASREDEFRILEANGFELPIINKIIEASEMKEGESVGDANEFFDQACIEIDDVMSQVIEKIRTMPSNHLEVKC